MYRLRHYTSERYEHTVPEDTVLALHQLCPKCTRFRDEARMLSDFQQGKPLRHGTQESYMFGFADEVESGYLSGCHLCALLWLHAGCFLMDPTKPVISSREVIICLQARNPSIEKQKPALWSGLRAQWWSVCPPLIGQVGVIDMYISAVRNHESSSIAQLFIHLSSSPNVNQSSVKDTPQPLSSRHDLRLSYIKDRYRDCNINHSKCMDFPRLVAPVQQLPSRLVDLRADHIRLRSDINDYEHLEYTTLSHMWGPDPNAHLRLTLGNLDNFKAEIPEARLSTGFQDAIRITKALGFQYIWIDSLCIIQDSNDDWEREARKMSAVYGRSSCNISLVHPPSDGTARLFMRDPRIELPCQVSPASSSPQTGPSLIIQQTESPLTRLWSANLYKGHWPLLSRSWAFQERLLCPRNIYYGSDTLYWECCQGVEDEFYGPVIMSQGSKAEFYSVFSADGHSGPQLVRKLITQWFAVVQAYRLGSLTYEADRTMAFAGIARSVQLRTNYVYLAGIWREFAELGLLWHIELPWHRSTSHYQKFCLLQKKQGQSASPSWSWFSVPAVANVREEQVDAVGFRICSSLCVRSPFALYKARVVSHCHPNLASDPDSLLHDFHGLSITLRAPRVACKMLWDNDVLRVLPQDRYMLGDAGWNDPREAMDYCHDDRGLSPGEEPPVGTHMVLTFLCASILQHGEHVKYNEAASGQMGECPEWQYAGLVVVPSSEQGRWRRVGVFVFTTRPRAGITDIETPFNWEDGEEDIVLV